MISIKSINIFFSLALISYLLVSCCNIPPLQKVNNTIVNGGGISNLEYNDSDDFFYSIKPGETFSYFKDNIFYNIYGPTYSNEVTTLLSNELIVDISFLGLEEEIVQNLLSSSIVDFSLTDAKFYESLISYLSSSQLLMSIDMKSLLDMYLDIMQSSELSIQSFLEFLLSNSLITQAEFNSLQAELLNLGFNLNDNISHLISYVESNQLSLSIRSDRLLSFIEKYELHSFIDFDAIKREMIVGNPIILLHKTVDKERTWYGDNINYTLSFTNIGEIPAADFIIMDSLPLGLSFLSINDYTFAYPSLEVKCMDKNQIIILRYSDDIKPGVSGSVTFGIKILD